MLPILLALVFIAIIFFVVIAGRPDEFIVSRSTRTKRSASRSRSAACLNLLAHILQLTPAPQYVQHC